MRAAKWIFVVVGALVTLVVAGVVAFALFVDPNRFKDDIADAVARETGRTLSLDGDIDLEFWPWFALSTGSGSLGNPQGFDGPPFVRWREARIRVRLFPLLRGRAVVDTVRIVGADFDLQRRADGTANWQGWSATTSPATDNSAGGNGVIAGLALLDSQLEFHDAASGRRLLLSHWRLTVGAIRPGEPIDAETAFSVSAGDELPRAALTVAGRYVPRTDATILENLRIAGTLTGGDLAEPSVPIEFSMPTARFLEANKKIEVPAWRARLGLFAGSGSLHGVVGDTPAFAGELALTTGALREALEQWAVKVPATRDASVLGPFELKTQWTYASSAISVAPIQLVLDDSRLRGELDVKFGDQPVTAFALQGDQIAIDRYLPPPDAESEPFVLPTAQLRALPVRGTLDFAAATLDETRMKRVRIRLLFDEQGVHANR
ncbi:MAG: AsmA family protein [Pseudomonadales bacterium]|nr:AsmA family protein [Pseudomonadales bacterium]